MNKIYTLLILTAFTVLMVHCSPKPAATVTKTPENTVAEAALSPEMQEGKLLWQAKCEKCHKLFAPESRTIPQWERVLPSMIRKSNLDEAQGNKVRAFIRAHALK